MVMHVEVTYTGQLVIEPEYEGEVFDPEEEVERAFDGTMAELVKLPVDDPALHGSISTGDLEVTVRVHADTFPDAIHKADSAIRSALHAAEVHTPDWDSRLRVVWHKVEADAEDGDTTATDDSLTPA